MLIIGLGASALGTQAYASLIGGTDSNTNSGYVALVSPSGNLTTISGMPSPGTISAVAVNSLGAGIVGGHIAAGGAAYAAFVSSTGVVTPLTGDLPASGSIHTVAINNTGMCLIGGPNYAPSQTYVGLIAANGTFVPLTNDPIPDGNIEAVAINSSGYGLIAGQDLGVRSASSVSSGGVVTTLTGGGFSGFIAFRAAAVNDSNEGLLGGVDQSNFSGYVGSVSSGGVVTRLAGGGIPTPGQIFGVAINNAGQGIVGGQGASAYAAVVFADNTVTEVVGLPASGIIHSVAINSSGNGLIGGQDFSGSMPAFAAFVASDATLTPITGDLPTHGSIDSVAINYAGACLIGGRDLNGGTKPYAALVAPNGTVTRLTGVPTLGSILSVSIDDSSSPTPSPSPLSAVTPQSVGPFSSTTSTQFAATTTVVNHLNTLNKLQNLGASSSEISQVACSEVAQNQNRSNLLYSNAASAKLPPYNIWSSFFGNYLHIDQQGTIPALSNDIAGVITGFDYRYSKDLMFGGGLGYAFNYVHYAQSIGHAKVQQEMACLYTSYERDYLLINAILWSGLYQLSNVRHAINVITAKAHTHGWILAPHFEIAVPCPFKNRKYFIEPFAACDYLNSWQIHYTETGRSGFNLVVPGQYAAFVLSEVGVRFYEKLQSSRGTWLFEQKLSYDILAPVYLKKASVFFVGSPSTFPIATGSSRIQNLGGALFNATFMPRNSSYPYIAIEAQTFLGSSYQSYVGVLNIGKDF